MTSKKCDGLTFAECELAILRMAVDNAEKKMGKQIVNSPEVRRMIILLENFMKKKGVICYGGTAINALLPKEDQFYNTDIEIPDYDFFSPSALEDAKELADLYLREGFTEVEAKSGQHHGTYKVYVNFIPIADITLLPKELFQTLRKEAVSVGGILYAPPNYLRMSMYLELSRPAGDISRWEKVLKRLSLLNNYYPLGSDECAHVDFQRNVEGKENSEKSDEIYENVKNTLVNQSVVFFGGYAISMYAKYMPANLRRKLEKIPDFDVLSEQPEMTAEIVVERLKEIGIKNAKVVKRVGLGEVIPEHYQIQVGKDTVAFIYTPIACHSYNIVSIDGQKIKIATIDTMLSYYLAFLYAERNYYDVNRILCMSKFLFEVQQKNRLVQKGLLKRFSIDCLGHQETIEEMRAEKATKYRELKGSRDSKEYEEWFLSYKPGDAKKPLKSFKRGKNTVTKTKPGTKSGTKTKKNKRKSKMNFRFF
jgi:Poly(A) polymerase catalytic subunit